MRLASVVLAVGLLACSRTPAEPEPAATTAAQALSPKPPPFPESGQPVPPKCPAPMAITAPELPKAATICPSDPEKTPVPMPTAKVIFPATNNLAIDVELAVNEHDIEKGLMYRREMKDDHGMLFKLEERRDHTFWMQNTCIPLDMLFIEEDGTIVGIVEGAEPLTRSERKVGCESRYVLEMNAGWSRKTGVKPGQKLALPSAVK